MANLQVGVAGNGTVTVGAGASVHSPASNELTLGTNNAERFRINSSGNLGVGDFASVTNNWAIQALRTSGTTTIASKNTGGNATVYIEASDTNTAKLELTEAGTGSYSLQVGNDNALMFFDDSSERLRIDSSGRLLYGTTSSTRETSLVLVGNSNSYTTNPGVIDLFVGNTPSNLGSMGQICFGTQNVVGARIDGRADQDWTVGSARGTHIRFLTTANGSTSLTERLRITNDGTCKFDPSAGGTLSITGSSAHTSKIIIGDNANTGAGNCLVEGGDGGDYFTIQSNGNVNFASGNGITFADSSTSSVLADYEEGTFTPTLTGSSTAGSPTYQHQAGWYKKVGNLVTAHVNLATTNTGSGAGNMRIGALPFTCASNTEGIGAVQYNQLGSGLPSGREGPGFAIIQNPNTYCDIRVNDSGSTQYTHLEIQTVSYLRMTIQYITA